MKFAKFLRTSILKNTCKRLLLNVFLTRLPPLFMRSAKIFSGKFREIAWKGFMIELFLVMEDAIEACSELCQTSKMERFAEIVNGF